MMSHDQAPGGAMRERTLSQANVTYISRGIHASEERWRNGRILLMKGNTVIHMHRLSTDRLLSSTGKHRLV
jgi:hypothetical protein